MSNFKSHYEVFPFETEHECGDSKQICILLGGKCYQTKRLNFPYSLFNLLSRDFAAHYIVPLFTNPQYFLLKIDFPSSTPLVKLINMNGQVFTVKNILNEFLNFYKEIYLIEQLTIEEEKVIISCTECIEEDFSRFETRFNCCPICSEDSNLYVFDCGHEICSKCTRKWFREKNTCPMCRRPIKPCSCGGKREDMVSHIPSIFDYIYEGIQTTGIYRFQPYDIGDILFSCLIYDRYSNMFTLIKKN